MGSAKKRSLKQAEKQQKLQAGKKQKQQPRRKSKQAKAELFEKKGELNMQKISEDLDELAKIKALTPFSVATKYNLKLSEAKNLLKTLEERSSIQQVASSGGLKIYKFIGNI